jgi:hypothetical protein
VGAAQYAVPSGAIFVSPSGSDSGSGSASSPFQTVGKAVSAASSGATIVLRAGTYHESVTLPAGKQLTVQAYPGEAVWFDGSRAVSGFVPDGSAWRLDGWTANFDHSPTYTQGAADNPNPSWSFVNPSYPMAAYPDMVFFDGSPLRQVGSLASLTSGTFYVDTVGQHLYVGSDPSGHAVRASDIQIGITVSSTGSVLRGFGVRRYATTLYMHGALRVLANNVTLDNLNVVDNATEGVFVGGSTGLNANISHVTADRNGILGFSANYADGLHMAGSRAEGNNTEHFNQAPVSGGFKITRSRGVSMVDSDFSNNSGPGLWLDESMYDANVIGNNMVGNAGHGMSFEISSKAVIADNLVTHNGGNGLKLNNAQYLQVWNNTITDNAGKPIWFVQDSRVASNLSTPGHDPRQSLPDPTVTWINGPASFRNNVIARTSSVCLLCVEDTALLRSAETMGATADGDVYSRATTSSPTWLVAWASGVTNPNVYTTVAGFQTAKTQEVHGADYVGSTVVDSSGNLTASMAASTTAGVPLTSTIAALVGQPTGTVHVGAWLG